MSEEKQPNQIEQIVNALDFNLKSLEEARGMTMADVKVFILDLLGTVRDMWEMFKPFFNEMEKLKQINETTEKEKKHRKEILDNNTDIKNMYL